MKMDIRASVIYILVAASLPSLSLSLQKIICEHTTDHLVCSPGQVLKVAHANYGRTSVTPCLPQPVSNCISSPKVNSIVSQACNGKQQCTLTAENQDMGEEPCSGIYKYIDVQYSCITVTPATTAKPVTLPPVTQPVTRLSPTTQSSHAVCTEYLVSGARGVKDNQMSASSEYASNNPADDHGAHRGRLYADAIHSTSGTYLRGGWASATDDHNQYLQVHFNGPTVVKGVVTQGRHVNPADGCCVQRVTKYHVTYSLDGVTWKTVEDGQGHARIFGGNTDQDTPVTNMLPCPVIANYIRVNPVDWYSKIAMRMDLIGCPANTNQLGTCPNGWTERPGSNECYLLTTTDMKGWAEARQSCLRQQGDLVKFDTIQERDWLKQEMTKLQTTTNTNMWWTGLNNQPRTDSLNYKWADGTTPAAGILQWQPTNPDNYAGQEHCAEIALNGLNDLNCATTLPYICEKSKFWSPPANQPPAVTSSPTTQQPIAPSTIPYNLPTPKAAGTGLGSPVHTGTNTFTTGCISHVNDCRGRPEGDYQSCIGCHFYMTCANSGTYPRRPCPANLVFDDNIKQCTARSSTCVGP